MEFITKNIFLIAVALVSGGMLLWPFAAQGRGRPVGEYARSDAADQPQDALVLDLRSAEDYAKGHILGAKNLPLADLERRAGELEKHKAKPVIVHCGDGNRAGGGVAALRKLGFGSVSNLSGGYRRLAAGRPAGGEMRFADEAGGWRAC